MVFLIENKVSIFFCYSFCYFFLLSKRNDVLFPLYRVPYLLHSNLMGIKSFYRFSPDLETSMGLVQHEGGPCGVLATIQVMLSFTLFYLPITFLSNCKLD